MFCCKIEVLTSSHTMPELLKFSSPLTLLGANLSSPSSSSPLSRPSASLLHLRGLQRGLVDCCWPSNKMEVLRGPSNLPSAAPILRSVISSSANSTCFICLLRQLGHDNPQLEMVKVDRWGNHLVPAVTKFGAGQAVAHASQQSNLLFGSALQKGDFHLACKYNPSISCLTGLPLLKQWYLRLFLLHPSEMAFLAQTGALVAMMRLYMSAGTLSLSLPFSNVIPYPYLSIYIFCYTE